MDIRHRLRNWGNPHNLTRLHLKSLAAKHGFSIGEHTYGKPKIRFAETGAKLTIGRFCSIADGVEIFLGGDHRPDFPATYPFTEFPALWPEAAGLPGNHVTKGDVVIGHDVWLGSQCLILAGVTIGHGAIIGARAVVTRDVPPYGIVAGNPARLIRRRFDDSTIARLLAAAWWDLPRERIAALLPLMRSDDIGAFLAAVERLRA